MRLTVNAATNSLWNNVCKLKNYAVQYDPRHNTKKKKKAAARKESTFKGTLKCF